MVSIIKIWFESSRVRKKLLVQCLSHKLLDQRGAWIVSALYLTVFPLIGILVACIGFCDPDTCWHLALGQWILKNHSLPYIDPFSSNVANTVFMAKDLPLMQHEWLSDLILYALFALFGLKGLLISTTLLSICSLVVIPSIFMLRNGVPKLFMLASGTLAIFASAFRLWVRPEEFSFLFMAILILINESAPPATSWKRVAVRFILIFFTMALWANCHLLFVAGIAYLTAYCFLSIGLGKSILAIKTATVTTVAAVMGTLCTPWHFQFWAYIYKLIYSPVTHANKENGRLTLGDLSNPTIIPLCLFLLLVWVTLLFIVRTKRSSLKSLLFSFALTSSATAAIILYRRMTPLALLVIFAALAKAFQYNKTVNRDENNNWATMLMYLGTAGLTCYLTATYFVPVRIPAPSRLFDPPYKAISYLELHQPPGRMLNDSKFGSMMEWTMIKRPDIFIDGRFDTRFDRQLIYDYNAMRLCQGNWRQLLDEYKICWLFFPSKAPIIEQLSNTAQWETLYCDDAATVLCRQKGYRQY